MDEESYPVPAVSVRSLPARSIWADIRAGEPVGILDVRAPAEFERWHITGPSVTIENIPYYAFIDGVDDDVLGRVPKGDPLIVVCAKGRSSAYVAGKLVDAGRDAVNIADGMNGWADLYEPFELAVDTTATIVQYQRPSSGCLAYLIVDGGEAAVVDPLRQFVDRYPADAADRDADLAFAIDTHVHADHVSGVRRLGDRTGARTVFPSLAVERGLAVDVDVLVEDADTVTVGETTLRTIHTPGHTTEMTSFLVDDRVLFTGDSLFTESVARPDLERGEAGQTEFAATLYETLHERILTLPDETVIAPGHASDAATPAADGTYTATIGSLKDAMCMLEMDRDAFISHILADMPPRPANFETIIAANLGREAIDDEEAFRLELGPNNCAVSTDALTAE